MNKTTRNTGDESEPDDEGENEYYLGKDKITKWKKIHLHAIPVLLIAI